MHSFRASFITPDYSNTKRMCSNDCFFVGTSWLEAKQGNRRRAEARGRSGEHPGLEGAGMKGQRRLSALVASAIASKWCICERFSHSFIHSSINISLAPPMYWKYFIVPGVFYVLSKSLSIK